MAEVKFGVFLPTGDFAEMKRSALRAEAEGFYSVSTNDHFFTPFGSPETPQLECFTALTTIAALTSRIRLAPAVVNASFRTPPMLAKIASTLDHACNGRLTLGLGAGWKRDEYEAHNYRYPSNSERLDQLDETVAVLKAMWTQRAPSFRGRHFAIDHAYNNPRPLQKPHPPIMLGGSGSKLLKIAAAHADVINLIPPIFNGKDFINDPPAAIKFDMAELKRRIDMLHGFARAAGRDPRAIEVSGLSVGCLSRSANDPVLRATAQQIGFGDVEAARRAPVFLMGTPEQVRREIRTRLEQFGMTWHIIFFVNDESQRLFVKEVMPEFAR
ncbi:MAG TPA: LLM class flavin-dependent oxidoreductase [Candidatus Binataceae bacterium]|jgi:probable F420-dependent oxidoreductase|nr:LLM class flavin-dependent oxidoreductase [Candidatus Binataceae bacterium]